MIASFGLKKVLACLSALPLLILATRAVSATSPGSSAGKTGIQGLVSQVKDIQATLKVTQCDPVALEQISKDFARPYALRSLLLLYKRPDKLRLDGRSAVLGEAVLILNGAERFYAVPRLHVQSSENLKDSPGKRQSLLEFGGIIDPEILTFMQAQPDGIQDVDGTAAEVYDLTYRGAGPSSHFRIWVDPETHVTLKRAWFDASGKLKATFYYKDARQIAPGFWFPSLVQVFTAAGKPAATTELSAVKVDSGLSDDLFAFGH